MFDHLDEGAIFVRSKKWVIGCVEWIPREMIVQMESSEMARTLYNHWKCITLHISLYSRIQMDHSVSCAGKLVMLKIHFFTCTVHRQ